MRPSSDAAAKAEAAEAVATTGGLSPLVVACLAATWIVWGSTYLAIRFALPSFPPFFQMGSRFVAAGLLLAGWMRWRGARWPAPREWRHAILVGALMLGGGMGGTAYAEQTIGSGLVVAFFAVTPMTLAVMQLAWGVRPERAQMAGILIGFVGVAMLVRGAGFQSSPAGVAAIVIATLSWSIGTLLCQHRLPLAPGAMGFASEMLCGGAMLVALSLVAGESPRWPPEPVALAAWLYLVVFGSLIAFNAYMLLLERASPLLASSYAFVNPVIALVLGVAIGGETVTAWEWLSAGVALTGVVLLLQQARRAD